MTADTGKHRIMADGYCQDCRTVPCRVHTTGDGRLVLTHSDGTVTKTPTQLDRIELLLRQIARRLGIPVDGDETEH